ncbi:MAG: VOC family protein [Mycobacterium sp.]
MTSFHAPLGAPTWIDLGTSDLERAIEFYGAVFGWTFESAGPEYGRYVNAAKDGLPVAGLMPNDPQWNMPDGWNTYLHTADIGATVHAVTTQGGQSCSPPIEIPGKGWMSMVTDSANGMLGLWQPTGHHGFEIVGAAGAPVWHQLTTREYDTALQFYRAVFGWDTRSESDTDEFRYTTAWFGDQQLLGVFDGSSFLPEEGVGTWTVFFGADDVDKTLEVIVAGGGAVTEPAQDTPYGRLAAATDPTGAAFNISSLES